MPRLALTVALFLTASTAGFAQESRPARPTLPPLGHPAGVFGEGVQLDTQTRLAQVAEKPEDFAAAAIRLEGEIEDVCQKKGCWMVLKDGDQTVRVRFKDYAFFVPRDAKGREVVVQGLAKAETISEEVAKHYAEEGENPEEAAKIKGPQQVISFTATGVVILGSDTVPPQLPGDELTARLVKHTELREGAGPKNPAEPKIKSFAEALEVLRAGPPTWELEFNACAEVGAWYVFGAEGGERYSQAFGVSKADGTLVRLADQADALRDE